MKLRQLSGGAGAAVSGEARDRARAQSHCLQQNIVWVLGTEQVVMSRPVAVVGVGQTKHAAPLRSQHHGPRPRGGRSRARRRGLEHKDIDAVVIGKAPDMLEGVAQPEQMLVGARRYEADDRVHGRIGRRVDGITAATRASGLYDRVLTVAFEKQSEGNAMWALAVDAVHAAARRRCRQLLRAVLPGVHDEDRRAPRIGP